MNSRIKKATKRQGRRVATVFTGAAACATAFAPAAMAATGHVAQAANPMNENKKIYGSIRSGGCANVPNWVHLQTEYSGNNVYARKMRCFGYDGLYQVSDGGTNGPMLTYEECGGNNFGVLIGTSTGLGILGNQTFGPGTYYRIESNIGPDGGKFVDSVYIYKWSGTDKCPESP